MSQEFTIDEELRSYLPPTPDQTTELLEQLLIDSRGPEDPLIVWSEENILIDGHRRYEICERFSLPYEVSMRSFENRDEVKVWMLHRQIARRNLADHENAIMTRRLLGILDLKLPVIDAVKEVQKLTGDSERTVYRKSEYAKAYENLSPSFREAIQSRNIACPRKYVPQLSKLSHDEQDAIFDEMVSENSLSPLARRFKNAKDTPQRQPEKVEEDLEDQVEVIEPPKSFTHEGLSDRLVNKKPDADVVADAEETDEPLSPNEIIALIHECERSVAASARMVDKLFSEHGLGEESRSSVWKRRVDQAYRAIGLVMSEVEDYV